MLKKPTGEEIMQETGYLKENKKVLELLKRIKKFQAFSDDDIEAFLEVGKLKSYEAGETIISKGDKDQWVYFLISGQVKIVKGEKTFAVLEGGGDLFGEMGVIDGAPRSASVWALARTMVLGLDCSNLDQRLKDNARVFQYAVFRLFAETLAERLRQTDEELLKLQTELKKKDKLIAQLKKSGGLEDETIWV
ncbi:MAG TPA: cyclic nucleotide-binding domain-containing protein [Desulfobacterales bacterium]|nr:cyclic nucleotide-binding domain-containing protein [Desulfobacterales bacterium]